MAELTLLYDERCRFCTHLAFRLARRPGIEAAPIGSATGSRVLRDLTLPERYARVHAVDAVGRRASGGAALPLLLRELPGGALPAAACKAFPGITEWAYGLAARHRRLVSRLVSRPRAGRPRTRAARGER